MHITNDEDLILATRRALVVSGLGAAMIFGAGAAMHGPSLPIYAARFGLGLPEASLIVSLHWFGACVSVLTLMLGARMGARWALALIGAGGALIALGVSWPLTLAGAMLVGAGQGVSSTVFNVRFLNEFGVRGPSFMGLSNAFFGLGAILAPLALVALGNDPQLVFGGLALIAAVLWPIARPPVAEPEATRRAALPFWRARWFLVAGAVAVAVEAGLAGLGPAALIAGGVSQKGAAFYTSGFFAAFLGSRLSLFWLAPHIPSRVLLIGGLSGVAATMAGAIFVATGPFFVLAGAFVGVLFPGYFVLATGHLGRSSRVGSLLVAAALTGGAAGPAGLSLGTAWAGADALFAMLGVLAAGAALLVVLVVPEAQVFDPKGVA